MLPLLIMILVGLATAPAQEDRPGGQAQHPIRVQVGLVSLYATVRDHQKHLVPNLTREDFRIFEEGQEQKVDYFARETALPITVGLLIDTSGSQETLLGAEQEAASRFLERVLRKGDLAMVITFDLDVDLLSDFTEDSAQLERAIGRARINAPAAPVRGPFPQRGPKGTCFYDAIYLASREKLGNEAGRKALVILTDAQDYGSKMRLEDALEAAQRTDTVIHIILISEPRRYFRAGLSYSGEGVAKKLSEETGGRSISVSSEKKLEEAFDQISEELRQQYVLGYYPRNSAQDGKFRKVRIETNQSDLKVLSRKGYYPPRD
jgi:VWFA-related protein